MRPQVLAGVRSVVGDTFDSADTDPQPQTSAHNPMSIFARVTVAGANARVRLIEAVPLLSDRKFQTQRYRGSQPGVRLFGSVSAARALGTQRVRAAIDGDDDHADLGDQGSTRALDGLSDQLPQDQVRGFVDMDPRGGLRDGRRRPVAADHGRVDQRCLPCSRADTTTVARLTPCCGSPRSRPAGAPPGPATQA